MGNGMPNSQRSAPLPKPMIVSCLVHSFNALGGAGFRHTDGVVRAGFRIRLNRRKQITTSTTTVAVTS